jgi:biopolymer transport protein ExbB
MILMLLSASWAAPALASAPPPPALAKMTAWSMFLSADWVVKSVMLMLVAASVITWGIAIAKYIEFRKTLRAMSADRAKIIEAPGLGAVPEPSSPISALILGTAREEFSCCVDPGHVRSADAMTERLSIRLAAAEAEAIQSMRSGFSALASIGATAPFIGLFGTVWGIMNSFIGISQAQTTNLAVVAPGIAEALLATALGLVAAIPAVLLYNVFSRRMANFRRHLQDISARVACLVSREVEHAQAGHLKIAV